MDKKTENRIWALYNQAKILSDDLHEDVTVAVFRGKNDQVDYGFVNAGNYDFNTYDTGKQSISYYPKDSSLQYMEVNADDIISLREPPKEKSPAADQSRQGMSDTK